MSTDPLGRLERVPLREIWMSEASDFTPWLARDENIAVLGDAIGIDLAVEAQEKSVGPFKADILCRDTGSESLVLVENQLERTDHTHLGQLMTYAAGLEAVTIVWVAQRFAEEHRAALDWLNEITDERFRFFGLEVELWRIGGSPAAPKFNVVSKPNDWTRSVSGAVREKRLEDLTETQERQLRFWKGFREYLETQSSSRIRPQKPLPQHWVSFPIGRTGFHLNAAVNTREHVMTCEFVCSGDDAKPHFYLLRELRAEIESAFGDPLEWRELPERKESRVSVRRKNADLRSESSWPEFFSWILARLERLHEAFAPRAKALNASEWETDET